MNANKEDYTGWPYCGLGGDLYRDRNGRYWPTRGPEYDTITFWGLDKTPLPPMTDENLLTHLGFLSTQEQLLIKAFAVEKDLSIPALFRAAMRHYHSCSVVPCTHDPIRVIVTDIKGNS